MKITFLGTTGAIITAKRSYPSILINNDLLLDCGEGTTQKLLQVNSINTVKLICLTHLHYDHFNGIFSLLLNYYYNNRTDDLTIIGPPKTKATIEKILDLFNHEGGISEFNYKVYFNELADTNEIQEIEGDYRIKCAKMDHKITSFAYRVEKKEKSFCYSGDTTHTQKLVELADKCNILICESTFPDRNKELAIEYGHCTLSDAARMARDANCEKLVVVHIAPFFFKKIVRSKDKIKEIFNKEVIIADDLLTLEI